MSFLPSQLFLTHGKIDCMALLQYHMVFQVNRGLAYEMWHCTFSQISEVTYDEFKEKQTLYHPWVLVHFKCKFILVTSQLFLTKQIDYMASLQYHIHMLLQVNWKNTLILLIYANSHHLMEQEKSSVHLFFFFFSFFWRSQMFLGNQCPILSWLHTSYLAFILLKN